MAEETSRRRFLQGAGAAAALSALPGPVLAQGRGRPPNILFIMADDLGYADLSVYGRRDYRTLVLDRLAADGLLMTQGYSNSAVCSPTRVALITGRYHQRLAVGMPEPIRGPELDPVSLPAEQATLPGLLRAAGYRTALVGKWHMGWPPEHGPLRHGYDSFFGVASGAVDHFTHREQRTIGGRIGLFDGESAVDRDGYVTDLLAARAVDEIRTATAARRPFMLSLHFTAPHWPWQGPGDSASSASITNLNHLDGGSLETFGEMVRSMDEAIGRVLAELERQDAARDTIVVFTSDNGGERFSDTWPLRGQKGDLLEGGIRVPLIVRWPAAIGAGQRSDQVMVSMDWLPTLLAAAGAPTNPAYPPDGENLLDVLRGAAPVRPRKLFWRFRARDQAAARDGDWKYLRIGEQEQLYDLARDPRERANLKDREAAVFARLKADWAAWNAQMLPYPPMPAAPAPAG
ncbi:sulfatase-like hydrolase/transferase [Sphingosinicella sp. YJ22]|uniref:sulfatase family protein n=1 Tax=Sphingosinicella sp. YJ22 TaxID=1104780 RepID=UPI001409B37C|nr:sulfatase-like hydrolase/transferase [Sphingosinicella sp. YJ22]